MSTAILTPTPLPQEVREVPADAGRRLNYRHLAAVHAVARAGGLTRAAEALQLAPPTLSAQIRDFEKTLGLPLFERVRGGLTPTEAGEVAIDYAEKIFATGCDLLDALEQHAAPAARVVGVSPQIPARLAAHWVEEMVEREPEARVVLSETDPAEAERALASGKIDVLLTTETTQISRNTDVVTESLGGCGLGFFAHRELAAELSADFPKCLDGSPFLGTSDDAAIDAWLRPQGVRKRVVAVADSLEVRRSLAAEGRGVFAAPEVMANALGAPGDLVWLGTADALRTQFTAVCNSDRYGPDSFADVASRTRRRVLNADEVPDADRGSRKAARPPKALEAVTEVSR
jgi:LysR family transcriptional activator of nhaA